MSILSVKNLVRHHRSGTQTIRAVDGVSFEIEAGSFTSIVGPSGSGKSTLLSLLAGLQEPTSGTVVIHGRSIFDLSEDTRAHFRRKSLGFVFQNFQLFEHFTALENVLFPLEILKRPYNESLKHAESLLASLGLGDRMTHYPKQLSGGEQQRVAIARAFANSPELLFADEPTGNLDSETGSTIMNAFLELQQKSGTTLILVTHDMKLAQTSDRILQMHGGRLIEMTAS